MKFKALIVSLFLLLIPIISSSHEMYVLTPDVAHNAVTENSQNPFAAIKDNGIVFSLWVIGAIVGYLVFLRISLWQSLQKKLNSSFEAMKRHAPQVVRITLGIALISSALTDVLFGPELPLFGIFGPFALSVKFLLLALGSLLILGFYNKLTSAAVVFLFVIGIMRGGIYTAVYASFLGAALCIHIREYEHYKKTAFFALRLCYGLAIIWSAVYAKFLYSNLALETIATYNITDYLPFAPLFIVLGAFLVEVAVGACIMLGIQLRLVAIIFTAFLIQSHFFFGEALAPHLILFGLNIALFAHGYDKYTVLKRYSKNELDPVL